MPAALVNTLFSVQHASTGITFVPPQGCIVQPEFGHDMATFTLYGADVDAEIWTTGQPVLISYGYAPANFENFIGYVAHTTPVTQRADHQRPPMEVTCVGASWPMKEPLSAVFTDRTVPSVVAAVAKLYSLFHTIDDHAVVWPSLASSGQTTWQFMCALAKRIGFGFCCNKHELRLVDINKLLTSFQAKASAPLYQDDSIAGGNRRLASFVPVLGEAVPGGGQKAARRASGIDFFTGEDIVVQSGGQQQRTFGAVSKQPVFPKVQTDLVAHSQAVATARLDGLANRNRFYIQADATVTGDPRVRQCQLVALDGVGSVSNGFWYCHRADHEFYNRTYQTRLHIGRDSYGDTGERPVLGPRQAAAGPVRPPAVLVNSNYWKAAWSA